MMAGIHRERGENLPGLGDSFEVDASPAKQSFVSDVTASLSSASSSSASAAALALSREQRIEAGLSRRCASLHDEAAEEEPPAGSSVSSREEDGQDVLF
jgi:hypothetical protein